MAHSHLQQQVSTLRRLSLLLQLHQQPYRPSTSSTSLTQSLGTITTTVSKGFNFDPSTQSQGRILFVDCFTDSIIPDYTYIQFSAELTSSQVATVTTVSVQATDSAQATLLLSSLSATLAFPTPTQTMTSTSGVSPIPTPPLSTGTTSVPDNTTSTTTSAPVQFTGGATPMHASFMAGGNVFVWAVGTLLIVPGFLMVWL